MIKPTPDPHRLNQPIHWPLKAFSSALLALTLTPLVACASAPDRSDPPLHTRSSALNQTGKPGDAGSSRAPQRPPAKAAQKKKTTTSKQPSAPPKTTLSATPRTSTNAQLQNRPTTHPTTPPDIAASADNIIAWSVEALEEGKTPAWVEKELQKLSASKRSKRPEILTQRAKYLSARTQSLALAIPAPCTDESCPMTTSWQVALLHKDTAPQLLLTTDAQRVEFHPPADFSADGHPELSFQVETCGAHTCFQQIHVFTSDQAAKKAASKPSKDAPRLIEILNTTEVSPGELPAQGSQLLKEEDPPQLQIFGGVIGSAGAGPLQRELNAWWRWDKNTAKMKVYKEQWDPASTALFDFHDGLIALQAADLPAARRAFKTIIDDGYLREHSTGSDDNQPLIKHLKPQLAQAAHFQLAYIDLLEDKQPPSRAQRPKNTDSPGARALDEMLNTWKKTADPNLACRAGAKIFDKVEQPDWLLNEQHLGYNSPVKFTPSGLCVAKN